MASAYRWPDRIFIHPDSRTKQGLYIATGPMIRLGPDADAKEIGNCVLNALETSQWDMDFSNVQSLAKERLKAAGFRSETAFMKHAKLVGIVFEADTMVIKPFRNGGNRGDEKGFHELTGEAMKLNAPVEAQAVGNQVIGAWELCS